MRRIASPSTTVDRPWWLPISSTMEAAGSARASSQRVPACPGLSHPGHLVGAAPHVLEGRSSQPANLAASGVRVGRATRTLAVAGERSRCTSPAPEEASQCTATCRGCRPRHRAGVRAAVHPLLSRSWRSTCQQPAGSPSTPSSTSSSIPAASWCAACTSGTPTPSLGELQNQASGYLFPLGPVYLLGDVLHCRSGCGAVCSRAAPAAGVRRDAGSCVPGAGLGAWPAVLAGLSYMLAPRLLSTIGALTGEALPPASCRGPCCRWCLRCGVGSTRGRAALLSADGPVHGWPQRHRGLAGGLPHDRAARPGAVAPAAGPVRSLAGLVGWCAWWLLPLLMSGRYGSPFLSYVETAADDDRPHRVAHGVRGTEHWVAYLALGDRPGGRPATFSPPAGLSPPPGSWRPGAASASAPAAWRCGCPVVRPLVGLFVLTAGSGACRLLVDRPWAAARRRPRPVPQRAQVRPCGAGGAGPRGGSLAALLPALTRRFAPPWTTMAAVTARASRWWRAVCRWSREDADAGVTRDPRCVARSGAYLDEQPQSRALVLPGRASVQTWGWTIDEPIQGLATRRGSPAARSRWCRGRTAR